MLSFIALIPLLAPPGMFSRALHRLHVQYFPAFCTGCMFSRAFHRLLDFLRFAPVAWFPRFVPVACFPAFCTVCMFSHALHQSRALPRLLPAEYLFYFWLVHIGILHVCWSSNADWWPGSNRWNNRKPETPQQTGKDSQRKKNWTGVGKVLALFVFMRKFVCLCLLGIKINYPGYFFLRFSFLASFLSRYSFLPALLFSEL